VRACVYLSPDHVLPHAAPVCVCVCVCVHVCVCVGAFVCVCKCTYSANDAVFERSGEEDANQRRLVKILKSQRCNFFLQPIK